MKIIDGYNVEKEPSFCFNCGKPKESNVCFACGAAYYDDPEAAVIIVANNYDPALLKERSLKFMAPFFDGTIRRMKEAKVQKN